MLILTLIGLVSYRSTTRLLETARRVAQTHKVLQNLEYLLSLLKDAETGQRGYVITGEERYLEPYYTAVGVVDQKINEIQELTSGSLIQQRRLQTVRVQIARKLAILEETLRLRKTLGIQAALQLTLTDKGKNAMDDVRKGIAEMEGEESALLRQQSEQANRGAQSTLAIIVFGSSLAFAIVAGSSFIIHREIAVRKRAEQERDRFFNLSLDMLCIAGFDGYFKQLNPAWEKTLDFTKRELLSKPYLEFIHPEDRESTLVEAGKLSAGGLTVNFENRYLCKDGSYKWLSWSVFPFSEQQLIYAVARDISSRRRSEEEIKKLNQDLEQRAVELHAINKELEAFTYSVSHDLRTPLRQVNGYAKILLEEFGGRLEPTAQRYLQLVEGGARHMGALIDDLLNLSRVGRRELARRAIPLNSLVEEVLLDLKEDIEGRNIQWKIGDLPSVECDPGLIKQVFANLLSNAIKFTRPRERALIQVGEMTDNEEKVVFIRDNGAGFNMKYTKKLFGVFQRLHREEDFEGTGVGLATVQRIIHKHGGRIWAEAEPDKGATFYFTLEASYKDKT